MLSFALPMSKSGKETDASAENGYSKGQHPNEVEDSKTERIRGRYNRDIERYHHEIEELNEKIGKEEDPTAKRHLEKQLLETRRALSDVLSKVNQL